MKGKRSVENGFQFIKTVFIMQGSMNLKNGATGFGLCWGKLFTQNNSSDM
ncbi:hypothetical protein H3294_06995 [Providencia stuartii]|jgi:hypothetical protein|nr:hypothetical protein [Providencia stuartii]MBN4864635.1 hypothetical protein [Providencia stuartii]